jgi:HD-GYP domain-containing protein (c-di-GMP phosphodiesterase class II)/pSer/pThr/pTyr-binding forkhead associated (FHA) protein
MRLLYQTSKGKQRWWSLTRRKFTIGRDTTCDIVLNDPKVSRIHAEILFENEGWVLADKNSTNGSFINGERITRKCLTPGDAIMVGNSRLSVLEGSDTSRVEWKDDHPSITAQVPVEDVETKLSEMTAKFTGSRLRQSASDGWKRGARPSGKAIHKPQTEESKETSKIHKLINHLSTIYNLSRDFTSILVTYDLFTMMEKHIYEIFNDVERFCLFSKSEDDKIFNAKFLSARNPDEQSGFEVSRSIFQFTVKKKVSVLLADATADNRFEKADSVVNLKLRSIMCAPLVSKGEVIGVLYCDNRSHPSCFDNQDLELFAAMANQIAVALDNARLYEDIQRSYHEAILALINAIEAKDPDTMEHTQRTSQYALGIAHELNLDEQQCQRVVTAAEVHDIGKIGVKERLISKQSQLSDTEYHTVQEHVLMGEKILKPITYLHYVLPIIRGHHEHFDGTGYPDGLKGEDIPLESRILAVADAFDAMTSKRPYNIPLNFSAALNECKKNSGTHFDPKVMDALARFIASNYELPDSPTFKNGENKGESIKPQEHS